MLIALVGCLAFCGALIACVPGNHRIAFHASNAPTISSIDQIEALNARLESDIMATIAVDGNDLVVRLSTLERIGALRGDIRLPLASVRVVRVSDTPGSELRGIRAPGIGVPGVISLCTRRGLGFRDFAAVYGRCPVLVVEMT